MDNKILAIVAVVVVVAAGGAAAFVMLGGGGKEKQPIDYGGELKVYGNANEDSVIDQMDIDYINAVIKGDKEKTTFSDANNDGKVDADDAVMMLNHLLTKKLLTEAQGARADIDGNGKINAIDLTLLKRILLA